MAEENGNLSQEQDTGTDDKSADKSGSGVEDIETAKKGAVSDLLKSFGLDSTDQLKDIIKAKNEADKASKSDLENSKADLKKANDNNAELSQKVTSLLASNAVLKAGVTAEHVNDATILAQARVSNGSSKDIDAAIKDVLKSNPQFTGDIKTGSDGTAVIKDNLGGNQNHRKSGIGERIAKLNAGRIIK